MSARGVTADAVVPPWAMTFNGRTWRDMPGATEDDQKMNFFFYRRGQLDVEEEERVAAESEEVREETALPRLRLVSMAQRRFGQMGRRKTVRAEEQREKIAEMEAKRTARAVVNERRARLKALLLPWCEKLGGIRQIAIQAQMPDTMIRRFVREDHGLVGEVVLSRVEAVMDALERGEWTVNVREWRTRSRPRRTPPGYEPYARWLEREAAKRGMATHSLRMYLDRHPEQRPEILKRGTRSWFVRVAVHGSQFSVRGSQFAEVKGGTA